MMASPSPKSLTRSAAAAYLCICVALALLLGLTIWGTYQDLAALRQERLVADIEGLRLHAQRVAGRLERDIETGESTGLAGLDRQAWLDSFWNRFEAEDPPVYAAVVGFDGHVWLHSSPDRTGAELPNDWYDRVVHEAGDDVVLTRAKALGWGEPAYDVHVPVQVRGQEVGEYHVGISASAVEQRLRGHQRAFLKERAAIIAAVLLIVLAAATSLFYIATHSVTARRSVEQSTIERATEVGALAGRLAHEIRNPLHAIQLNLHTFKRAQKRKEPIPPDEVNALLEESVLEIDRIEQLMQQLVNFATPEKPRDEIVDLTNQLRAVVDFLHQELMRSNIDVELQLPHESVFVKIDHGRLRQIVLNLLQNAQQAMKQGGRLLVDLRVIRDEVQITIADNGPGIPEPEREKIFEPFYSTKEDGTGLGLALVQRYAQEANGTVTCEGNPWGGATFSLLLPTTTDS